MAGYPILSRAGSPINEKRKEFVEIKLHTLCEGIRFSEPALKQLHTSNTRFVNGLYNFNDKTQYQIPHEYFFPDNTIVKITFNSKSRFNIGLSDDAFVLFEGKRPISEVFFPEKPNFYSKKTRDGVDMSKIIQVIGRDCIKIYPLNFCLYEQKRENCKFCDIKSGRTTNTFVFSKKTRQILEACREANMDGLLGPLLVASGVYGTDCRGAKVMSDIVLGIKAISKKDIVKGSVSIVPPRKDLYVELLKKSGIEYLTYNLEVYDPFIFERMCPGKASDTGRDGYFRAFEVGVQLFGKGKVRSNFVAGLEPLGSLFEGFYKLAEMGVVPTATILNIGKESEIKHLVKKPEINYFRQVFVELSKIYRKFDFKPPWDMFCESHSLDAEGQFLE